MTRLEWFEDLKMGDRAAFENLVKETQNMVYRVIYAHVQDRTVSEDLTQETFLKAWLSLNGLKDPLKLNGWLCSIARHTAIDWVRKQRPQKTLVPHLSADLGEGSDDLLIRARRVLKELDPYEREMIFLRYQQGLSYKEIAAAMEMSSSGVGEKLFRIRAKMRESIKKREESI